MSAASVRRTLALMLLFSSVLSAEDKLQRWTQQLQQVHGELQRLESRGQTGLAQEVSRAIDVALQAAEQQVSPQVVLQRRANALRQSLDAEIAHSLSALSAVPLPTDDETRRWQRLKDAAQDGSLHLPPSETPLVHWLHHAASPGKSPAAEKAGRVPIKLRIQHLQRPVVLALSSDHPTAWLLQETGGANVVAVLLLNMADEFTASAQHLVYRRECMVNELNDYAEQRVRNLVGYQIGRSVDIVLPVVSQAETIMLGPRDTRWTRAYVAGELQRLQSQLRARRNRHFAKTHAQFEFPSVVRRSGPAGTAHHTLATYSLNGPLVETKTPLTTPVWNYTQTPAGEFGLHHAGKLMRQQAGSDRWAEVNMPPQMPAGMFLRSLTYDSRRNRIVALSYGGTLYALDLKTSNWATLTSDLVHVRCIRYSVRHDALLGIEQQPNSQSNAQQRWDTSLVHLDSVGQRTKVLPTNCYLSIQTEHGRPCNELALTNKYLVAVQHAAGFDAYPSRPIIRVFALSTGDMVYQRMQGAEAGFEFRPPGGTMAMRHGPIRFADYAARLRTAAARMVELRQTLPEKHHSYAEEFKLLQDPMRAGQLPRSATKIYWLRTFADRTPMVHLTDKSGPIVLVLSSFDAQRWRLKVDDGVVLKELLFVGGTEPEILGLPAGVPVRMHLPEDVAAKDKANLRQPRYQETVIREMVSDAKSQLEQVDLNRRWQQNLVSLGSGNADLITKSAQHRLNEFIQRMNRQLSAQTLPTDFRFGYCFRGPLRHGFRNKLGAVTLAQCNYHGPLLVNCRPISNPIKSVAYMGQNRFFASYSPQGVGELVQTDSGVEESPVRGPDPETHVLNACFDRKTGRLFCQTSHGFRVLRRGVWSSMEVSARFPDAWCHDSQRQRFYFLIRKNKSITEIHDISESGATIRRRKLPVPVPCGFNPNVPFCFAFCDGKYIIVVVRDSSGQDTEKNRSFVLDAESLEILHRGPFRPHVEYQPLTAERFLQIWQQLAEADSQEQHWLKLQLLAGMQDTVELARQRLGVGAPEATQERLDRLIQELDADRFADRDAAFQQLSTLAEVHQQYLRDALAEDLSVEQRLRIRALLNGVTEDATRMEILRQVLEEIKQLPRE